MMMMMTSISEMANFLTRRYSGTAWRNRVFNMSDAQITATYFKVLRQDEKRAKEAQALKGTQTRMNLEAYKGSGS